MYDRRLIGRRFSVFRSLYSYKVWPGLVQTIRSLNFCMAGTYVCMAVCMTVACKLIACKLLHNLPFCTCMHLFATSAALACAFNCNLQINALACNPQQIVRNLAYNCEHKLFP